MQGNKPFNHEAHCRQLEEAETELRILGKDALAAAVGRALMIHRDMQGRYHNTKREAARLHKIADTLERYSCHREAPWIGTDLFSEEQD